MKPGPIAQHVSAAIDAARRADTLLTGELDVSVSTLALYGLLHAQLALVALERRRQRRTLASKAAPLFHDPGFDRWLKLASATGRAASAAPASASASWVTRLLRWWPWRTPPSGPEGT